MLAYEPITVESPYFQDLLRVRSLAYHRECAGEQEPLDAYSWHFIAREGEQVLGGLRVTPYRGGPLDAMAAYPTWLLEEFGEELVASSRMCVQPHLRGLTTIPEELRRLAWRYALPLGIRVDVSKARVRAIPFYLRMGYRLLRDSLFDYERWSARCGLIIYPAHPGSGPGAAQLFGGLDDPCELADSARPEMYVASRREALALLREQPVAAC